MNRFGADDDAYLVAADRTGHHDSATALNLICDFFLSHSPERKNSDHVGAMRCGPEFRRDFVRKKGFLRVTESSSIFFGLIKIAGCAQSLEIV